MKTTYRTVVIGLVLVGARLFALADSNVIGFWDFKDGTVGEDAGTVSASVGNWTGTAYKANASGNKGTLPTYSDACPSVKIFTDASHREVLVSNPKSLHFSLSSDNLGGYVDIANLSTELTSHTEFTVEFYGRFDDNDYASQAVMPWTEPLVFRTADRYVCVTFGQGDVARIRCGCYNIEDPKVGPVSTGTISQLILNTWVHFAFVYEQTDAGTHSGNLKCYVNRAYEAMIAYTNTPLGGVSHPLRLGTSMGNGRVAYNPYNFRGDICALRVKSVALDENGFMSETPYAVQEGEMLGFWDFKDGAVGASATSVANKGCLTSVGTGNGEARNELDTGKVPVFSDDVPGLYIYPSSSRIGKRLVDNPQSLLFTTENAPTSQSVNSQSVGGGVILFPNLGSAISDQRSYTVECFFKDEDWSNWQYAAGLFGFTANKEDGATAVNVQPMVSSVKDGKTTWNAKLDTPINATYNKDSTWKDGDWHHLAVVYDGSVSNISLYVDRELGQTVAYTNYYRAGERFVLGSRADSRASYAFRGKVSCLRITAGALGPDDFMTAVKRLPGLVVIVR